MKKSKTSFDEMTMATFRDTIVLGCVRRSCKAGDPIFSKKGAEFEVLATIISIEVFDVGVELISDVILKINENAFNIRFLLERVEPSELCEMINENNIKTITID